METAPLTDRDEALIARARETCADAFDADRFDGAHVVAAALRDEDGDVHDGVSLPASVGRASICAEPVALGAAVADGATAFETVAAVAYPLADHDADRTRVIPPCGACRELIADYGDSIRVVVPVDGDLRIARAIDLLPTRTR